MIDEPVTIVHHDEGEKSANESVIADLPPTSRPVSASTGVSFIELSKGKQNFSNVSVAQNVLALLNVLSRFEQQFLHI